MEKINAYGELFINENSENQYYVKFDRIENLNPNYKHFGFGTLMMKTLFNMLSFYEEINHIEIINIIGTIGYGGEDNPGISMPFYKKFDNYQYSNNKIVVLEKERFNLEDLHLEYTIKNKK